MKKLYRASIRKLLLLAVVAVAASGVAHGQEGTRPMETVYEKAEQMLSWNLNDKIYTRSVSPNWIDDHRFWYRVDTRKGTEYRVVDASEQTKTAAIDHQKLAAEISNLSEMDIDPMDLKLSELTFDDSHQSISFHFKERKWRCSLQTYSCTTTATQEHSVSNSVTSPNEKWAAYRKDHNIWVRNLDTGEDLQLTDDGEKYYGYGTNNHGWWRSERPIITWSPDSRRIATFRQDDRGVGKIALWETKVGRPDVDIWPYALPGDTVVPMLERVVLDLETNKNIPLAVEPDHHRSSNCCGLVRNGQWTDTEWNADGEKLAFVSTSRDYKEVKLRIADAETGEVTEIFQDRDEIFFESNLKSRGFPNWRVLHESNEFIWFNRSDNWGHLYLHDLATGEMKNRITTGDWNVVDIVSVDEQNRVIYFTSVGVDADRDPYHEYLYRVNFDGTGMELLSPGNAHHSVSLSPDRSYIVDTFSDFQTPRTTVLRNVNGEELMTLESSDIEDLMATGWQKPVPFSTKARHGETDIYGIMLLPSDFDSTKTYPIINAIYPGPQGGSVGSRHFSASRRGQAQALAELGFVVVSIDAMGSSPIRSRDFHTAYAGNMIDNGLPDQIAAMRQLADRYSFIDLDRAGIYGHSGGGFATAAALTQYPEFFKVGVAGAGNHDNRNYTYYWGEKYQGLLEEEDGSDNYAPSAVQLQAENLQGKLMLSYGSMDTNVHPGMTLLLVDELIRHNKDFELVVFPNRGHGYANEPYNIRRTWDFFVDHLAGKTPPKEYQISR